MVTKDYSISDFRKNAYQLFKNAADDENRSRVIIPGKNGMPGKSALVISQKDFDKLRDQLIMSEQNYNDLQRQMIHVQSMVIGRLQKRMRR